jgi:hypothetical protein
MSSETDITKGQTHWTCPNCNFEYNSIDRDFCWSCKKRRPAIKVDAQTTPNPEKQGGVTQQPQTEEKRNLNMVQSSEVSEGSTAAQRIDEQVNVINGDYLVIPFIGRIKSGFFSNENAETVSRQLQSLINQYSQQGWEFHNIAKIDIEVTPGCLASLFGAKTSYITFDQVIFRRARP